MKLNAIECKKVPNDLMTTMNLGLATKELIRFGAVYFEALFAYMLFIAMLILLLYISFVSTYSSTLLRLILAFFEQK